MVYIVGAGPGDRKLITLKGFEVLKSADVVIYDYLVNSRLLELCKGDCERLYVGKKAGHHSLTQEDINTLLVEKATQGLTVVRLKGGDPFVFGRGGEEALELARRKIDFEIVPGVTAATAAAAYAGIPLTHRGLASSAVLVTGHEDPTKDRSDIPWKLLAQGRSTLVFYMGVRNLPEITEKLMEFGRPEHTPVALIRWGTLNSQETLTGTLSDIASKAEEADFQPPALIVVGEVVKMREELRWFDRLPLFGKKVVVTRSRNQQSRLTALLSRAGADVIEFPTIEIREIEDLSPLDRAIADLGRFSWLVFTSTNSVQFFFRRLMGLGYDARKLNGLRVAVIGRETGASLLEFGITPDLVPERYTSEGTLEVFRTRLEEVRDTDILYPASEIARDVLPEGLERLGARVTKVTLYRNLIPDYPVERVDEIFESEPDLVTFTSSSTVSNLVDILNSCGRSEYLIKIKGASIGPVTSAAAGENDISVVLEAHPHTIEDLAGAIEEYLSK
jgi:uroporphyrinogen III methyltransferase/synthase